MLKEYPDFDVYLDSPLAIEATKVFTLNMKDCFDEEALALVNSGINPLVFRVFILPLQVMIRNDKLH